MIFEATRGKTLPLPSKLARLYGSLRVPLPKSRPHVISNFVTTLDGVVSLGVRGHASGGDISGFSAQDRMVMGLLRAISDVVIVGAGTLAADSRHVWTADRIFPGLAPEYRQLRAALGKYAPPLMVVVSAGGRIDLRLPVFNAADASVMIVTTATGEKRLERQRVPGSVEISAARSSMGAIRPGDILDRVRRRLRPGQGKVILVEGGPKLLGTFYAGHALDEQFLTLAPQIAGRDAGDQRLGLVMGRTFAPRHPLWGTLTDLRRGGSHLFLRYSFSRPASH